VQTRPDSPAARAGQPEQGNPAVFSGTAANATPLRSYWVRHLRGRVVERQFEAVAADSLACATDHAPLEGCCVDVMPLAEWRARCEQEQRERGELTDKDLAEIERDFGIDRRNLARALDQRTPLRGFA
jgi:hypothetical protein